MFLCLGHHWEHEQGSLVAKSFLVTRDQGKTTPLSVASILSLPNCVFGIRFIPTNQLGNLVLRNFPNLAHTSGVIHNDPVTGITPTRWKSTPFIKEGSIESKDVLKPSCMARHQHFVPIIIGAVIPSIIDISSTTNPELTMIRLSCFNILAADFRDFPTWYENAGCSSLH